MKKMRSLYWLRFVAFFVTFHTPIIFSDLNSDNKVSSIMTIKQVFISLFVNERTPSADVRQLPSHISSQPVVFLLIFKIKNITGNQKPSRGVFMFSSLSMQTSVHDNLCFCFFDVKQKMMWFFININWPNRDDFWVTRVTSNSSFQLKRQWLR